MRNEKINHPTEGCRHSPVGRTTRLINHFRYWFIFTDYSIYSFSYTVGMVKCAKCGKLLRIPDMFYSFPYNLLYMVCYAIITWGEMKLLTAYASSNVIALGCCIFATLLVTYFVVDRVLWFGIMHFCKWKPENVNSHNHKLFVQRESKRFADDRKIKYGMWFLGTGLGQYLHGTPPEWFAYAMIGTASGLVIYIAMRTIKNHMNKKIGDDF